MTEFDNTLARNSASQPVWWVTLRANLWIPLAIFLLWWIAPLFEAAPGVEDGVPGHDRSTTIFKFFANPKWYLDVYHSQILMIIGINIILAVSLQLINGISGQFSLGHAGFMAV